MIIAPRDHGKTTNVAVARTIWELGNDPNLRIKIACQSDSKAIERLFEIKDHLERNERVQTVFPHLVPADRGSWSKHKIVVQRTVFSKDASIEALGITSTATGGRCDLLIADDIVDRRNAIQFPQIRETIKHAWKSDWTNLLEPDGRVVYICTLWHTADLSHELMENPAYTLLSYAIGADMKSITASKIERGKNRTRIEWEEPLWEHWSTEALQDRKEEIGSVEFDRGFRNIALSGQIIVIQPEWIKYFDPFKIPEHLAYYQGFDLAISKRTHADFFAVVTVGVDFESSRIYVVDAWHGKLSFIQQAQVIINQFLKWDPEEQAIESTAYQESLPEYLDSLMGQRIDGAGRIITTTTKRVESSRGTTLEIEEQDFIRVPALPIFRAKPRLDKMSRLKSITPYIEREQVLFHPKLNPESVGFVKENGDLITEITQFPLSRWDDLADAFTHAVSRAARHLALRGDSDEDDGPVLDGGVRILGI